MLAGNDSMSTCIIQLTPPQMIGCATFFKYPRVQYNPMNSNEARKCLKDFSYSVHKSLTIMHTILDLAHMDVRLDNICFNQDHQPVFIDLDRSCFSNTRLEPYGSSCMYNQGIQAGDNDWIQLGWLIAWVLDEKCTDYHHREFERLPETLQDSETLQALIERGM